MVDIRIAGRDHCRPRSVGRGPETLLHGASAQGCDPSLCALRYCLMCTVGPAARCGCGLVGRRVDPHNRSGYRSWSLAFITTHIDAVRMDSVAVRGGGSWGSSPQLPGERTGTALLGR
jgi:hypothetical protein